MPILSAMHRGSFCSGCGERLRDGARFCDRCGRPVDSGPSATPFAGGDIYRSTRLVVGQQRVMVSLGFAMMGVLMIVVGLLMPSLFSPFVASPTAFRIIPIAMGIVLIAFSAISYFISRRNAEQH